MRWTRITLVLLLSAGSAGCLDTVATAYPTMQHAIDDGAVARGWVPGWLPSSAIDLREAHDLDTNEHALSFHIPAGIPLRLPSQCEPALFADAPSNRFSLNDWPDQDELQQSYTLHRCTDGFLGVHRSERRVVHWHAIAR